MDWNNLFNWAGNTGVGSVAPNYTLPSGQSSSPSVNTYDPNVTTPYGFNTNTPSVDTSTTNSNYSNTPYGAAQNTGGGGGGVPAPSASQVQATNDRNHQADLEREVQNRYNQIVGGINDGYNQYFGQLDNIFNNLNGQRSNQEGIANNTHDQGVSDLNATADQNENILNNQRSTAESNRTRNLNDVGDSLESLFRAGNTYLGSRGAADSSAANQYAYALAREGSKERSKVNMNTDNILNDINTRETNLRTTVTQATKQLDTERQNAMLGIANWFADAQNQIYQAKGQGQLNKSKDLAGLSTQLLQYGLNQLSQIQANYTNQQSQLQQWALTKSQDINQLKSNMAAIGGVNYNMPQAGQLAGAQTSGGNTPGYFPGTATGSTEDQNIFKLLGG